MYTDRLFGAFIIDMNVGDREIRTRRVGRFAELAVTTIPSTAQWGGSVRAQNLQQYARGVPREDEFGKWAIDEVTWEQGNIDDKRSCFWTLDDNEYAWQSWPLKGRQVKRRKGEGKEKGRSGLKRTGRAFPGEEQAQNPEWWSEEEAYSKLLEVVCSRELFQGFEVVYFCWRFFRLFWVVLVCDWWLMFFLKFFWLFWGELGRVRLYQVVSFLPLGCYSQPSRLVYVVQFLKIIELTFCLVFEVVWGCSRCFRLCCIYSSLFDFLLGSGWENGSGYIDCHVCSCCSRLFFVLM